MNTGKIEKALNLAQAELRSVYKRLGWMDSNVLLLVDEAWEEVRAGMESPAPPGFQEYVAALEGMREISVKLVEMQKEEIDSLSRQLEKQREIGGINDQLKALLDAQLKIVRHSRDNLKWENQRLRDEIASLESSQIIAAAE